MRLRPLAPALLACGLALPLLAPGLPGLLLPLLGGGAPARAFSLSGTSLDLTRRDFRTFNNFSDLTANDNWTPDPDFPGHQGAVMAIWKASVEWSSALHGSGGGDPHQPGDLGSGGANFDVTMQGEALDVGTIDANVHSELPGSAGGIYAFTEVGTGGGWRIRYYGAWTWDDGPGTAVTGIDLQGVATHEYGHALGLGHSSVAGATMAPAFLGSGVSLRSIEADDVAGLQAIYGVAAPGKVRVTGVAVSGQTVTVTGADFAATGNELWLTQATEGGTGDPVVVGGLAASGGGTQLTATLPPTAGSGDLLVRRPGGAGADLSNPWPLALASGAPVPTLTGVLPASVPALVVDSAAAVTLQGTGLAGATAVRVDGVDLPTTDYQQVSDTMVTLAMPRVSKLGAVTLEVVTPGGSAGTSIQVTAVAPTVDLASSSPGFLIQSAGIDVALAGAPGDVLVLCTSPSSQPTVLPGVIDLAIGANLDLLAILGTYQVPAAGWLERTFQTGGILPTGLTIHVQAAGFLAAGGYALPGTPTNVQTGVVLL